MEIIHPRGTKIRITNPGMYQGVVATIKSYNPFNTGQYTVEPMDPSTRSRYMHLFVDATEFEVVDDFNITVTDIGYQFDNDPDKIIALSKALLESVGCEISHEDGYFMVYDRYDGD